jgi:hypothetical protein
MSDEFEKQARSIANASGFPLQIRVANIAEFSKWKVLLEEHPWRSDETRSEGPAQTKNGGGLSPL